MKKKSFTLFFVMFWSIGVVLAQYPEPLPNTKLPTEAASFVYFRAKDGLYSKLPAKTAFPHLQPTALPTSMQDTLQKYDWIHLADYHYRDDSFSSSWDGSENSFMLTRYLPNGRQDNYHCSQVLQDAPILAFSHRPKVSHTRVQKIGEFSYILQDEEGEGTTYARIISYQNHILIYDVSQTGSLYDSANATKRFRKVFLGIPKKF